MLLREREREKTHAHKRKPQQKRHEELKTLKPENHNTRDKKNSKP
jgi:hypothetical protein